MKTKDVIRARKDADYRQNLSAEDRAKLPAHPSGMIELSDADLGLVSGGCGNTVPCRTYNCTQRDCGSLGLCHTVLCR